MDIKFNHVFGLQSQAAVYHYYATLENVLPSDHDTALESGWLASILHGQPQWYQCRSTRCDLSCGNYHMMPDAQAGFLDLPWPCAELDHIYSAYCYHKKYKKYFEVDQYLAWDRVLGYRDGLGQLIAWSKLRHYSHCAVETVLFAWDYANPALRLGQRSLEHELAWAQQQGYRYVYMGPGYEKINRYKADVQGFEWWTGSAWSKDRDQYVKLCDRDSRIRSCEDLHDLGITL